jgi:transcriptional regulator with XRE-family HTH domain
VRLIEELPIIVRASRRQFGLSLREVSELTGVPFNTISRFERGIGDIQSDNLIALIKFVDEW